MRKVGLFEAKQKLSELVRRAGQGERIGITMRGKLTAEIGPVRPQQAEKVDLKQVFAEMEKIRKRSKKVPGVTVKSLIEEGRT
jgi:prevent-host-death family protein